MKTLMKTLWHGPNSHFKVHRGTGCCQTHRKPAGPPSQPWIHESMNCSQIASQTARLPFNSLPQLPHLCMPKSIFQPSVDLQLETDSGSSFKECSSAGRVRQMRQEHGWHDRTWQANWAPQAPCASELMHRPVQQHGRPHLLGSEGAFFLTAHLDHLDLPENPEPGWMHGWMYQRMDGRSAWWQVLGIPTLYQFLCMYAWTCLS